MRGGGDTIVSDYKAVIKYFVARFRTDEHWFFAKSRKEQKKWWVIKWVMPAFLNAVCMFLCAWMLHIATYFYVNEMLQWEKDYELRPNPGKHMVPTSQGLRLNDTSFGSLNDPLEADLGFFDIDIGFLDLVAAIFPMLFFMSALLTEDLRTWTKILLCNSLLALCKGMLGAMTTVPDSTGWAGCKARLGESNVEWLGQRHSMMDLLYHEAVGVNGKHMRWCADMLFSGHTYLTTLYALGLYEVVRVTFGRCDYNITKNSIATTGPLEWYSKLLALFLVASTAIVEQLVEITCVILNRFHYSMDVFVAVLLTFLFYTNGAIAVATKRWVQWPAGEDKADKDLFASRGDVLLPPCCFPFCWFAGREHIFSDKEMEGMIGKLDDKDQEWIREQLQMSESIQVTRKVPFLRRAFSVLGYSVKDESDDDSEAPPVTQPVVSFHKGELVRVLRSNGQWASGKVEEECDRKRLDKIENLQLVPGAVLVVYDEETREKWIQPQNFHKMLRHRSETP
mmetsp:Transcript_61668/g.133574  ORF Transcript_61668/g.133574 Transcript_61668/m.133574 type:complete len:508 (-) Transcript_61668:213-1736(-)